MASALAWANPLPVQTYYVPLKEAHVYAACAALGHLQATNQNNIISIVANSSNTIVYYDHWEDGYELDLAHPAQATTLMFGDNNASNGIPPGFTNDVINAGTIVMVSSIVNVLVTNTSVIRYDGGDKFGVTRPVAVTYSSWPADPGPVLADGVEVYDTTKFGTNFFAPVGTNTGSGGHFEYTSLNIMAGYDNTLVHIDADANGTFETAVTLQEGQAQHVNGGVLRGARVRASKPVQVAMITGDIGVNYEMRWYTLYSREFWGGSYYTPVGRTLASAPVSVWLYNPHTGPLAVQVTAVGTQSVVNVAAGGNFEYIMPGDTGARFVSTNGAVFSTVLVVDSDADGASYDWGSSLVPGELLTPEALNGWGPGSSTLTVNGSPVWVMAQTTAVLFVDYDGNPQTGLLTDGFGRKYDTNFVVTAFQSRRILDPSGDNDQTGVRVYTTNYVPIVAMWGQDANVAGAGNPYLDIGTAILPIPSYSGVKSATLTNDVDGDGWIDPGDELVYMILIRNEGISPMLNVWVHDALPSNVIYVAGSTVSNGAAIADAGVTAFPLDEGGKGFGTLPIGAELLITYRVTVTNPFPLTTAPLVNRVTVNMTGGGTFSFYNETPVYQADLGISKSASPAAPPLGGTLAFSITVTNRGPWQATGVTVHDVLPAGLVYLSHSGGTYTPGSGVWSVGTLAAGASATLTIVAQVTTLQSVTNIATLTHVDQHDPVPDTNTPPVVVKAQPVMVDVTNAPTTVTFDVTSYVVGGTNVNVVGGMWVSNATAGGAALAFGASSPWVAPAMGLVTGANTLVVHGTNSAGYVVWDSVVITRGGIGTGAPFVDITNTTPTVVSNPVTSVLLGGTNNSHVIGGMWWSNLTTGVSGPLVRDSDSNGWHGTFGGLAVGANTLRAYGSNLTGMVVFDMYVITRLDAGSNPPFVDITNAAHAFIPFGTPSTMIGGTNYNVVGTMWWSNQTTGVGGTLPAATPWTLTLSNLSIGVNVIRVYGTNVYGAIAFDSVPINQGGPGTGTPFTDITNAALTVTFDVTNFAPAGTNNLNVVGGQWASNATAGGVALVFPASVGYMAPALPLSVGPNTLVVYGTNKFGVLTSDSVVITRGAAGTGVPFVDITNPPAWVSYDVTSFAVAGTNNANVVGDLWVSNSANGSMAVFESAGAWEAAALALEVGANLMTVYGSNAFGVVVSDSVVIMRGPAGTGVPFVDVTNAPAWVNYDVTSYAVAGTNNVNVVGGQWVSNSANGSVAAFAAASTWIAPDLPLEVGANLITVYGTNVFGVVASDSVVITRAAAGTGPPFVDITNTVQHLPFDVTAFAVAGTNNSEVVGTMLVSNLANSAAAFFPAAPAWTAPPLPLVVGVNIIAVYGTNAYGVSASDNITFIHFGPCSIIPDVVITNAVPFVPFDIAAFAIAGTNNISVTGTMHIINVHAGAESIFPAMPVWTAPTLPLAVGSNTFYVRGSNILGVLDVDVATIVRGGPGTGVPFLDITTTPHSVYSDVPARAVAGTNNLNVAGGMWVSNAANGSVASFAAAPAWVTPPVPLQPGANTIHVFGTNAYGVVVSDAIVVTQLDHTLTITITAPNNGNHYAVNAGAHGTNVAGLVSLVPDLLHWSNELTGAAGVLSNHTQFAFPSWLALGTNVIRVTAHTANGSATTHITIIVRGAPPEPSTRVLCVWPHLIGATQTGTVEFVSTQAAVYSLLVMTPTGTITIATGACAEDWNLVPFYGGALPFGIGQGTNALYLKVANEEPVYAAAVLVVPDLQLGKNVINHDLDGDLISVSYKGAGQIRAQGRTLFVTGGSPKDKLSLKVKAVQKGTDRGARMCGVFTDSGFGSVQVAGALDRFEADGAVKKLRLRNGSLGQPCLTRLNFVRFASAAGKSAVQIKGGGVRANMLVGTQAPDGSVATRGALKTLAVSGGDIGSPLGRRWLQASSIGTVVAKGSKRRGGVVVDYSFYLTGETKPGSGLSIGKMMVFALADTSGGNTNVHIVCGHDALLNPLQQATWAGVPVGTTLGALSVRGGLSEGTVVVDRLPGKYALPGINKVKWIVSGIPH